MYEVTKLPSDIWGLTYIPSIEPKYSDQLDSIDELYRLKSEIPLSVSPGGFSQRNKELMESVVREAKPRVIFEIGVGFEGRMSSTQAILHSKPEDCLYIGLDHCGPLPDDGHNKKYFCCNTLNHPHVRQYLANNLGGLPIDILHIDGNHSVRTVVNDWTYTDLLSNTGIVVLHDTSVHPGPYVILDAIDRKLFTVEKYFEEYDDDWGMAIVRRI